jgi:hypothetical protein
VWGEKCGKYVVGERKNGEEGWGPPSAKCDAPCRRAAKTNRAVGNWQIAVRKTQKTVRKTLYAIRKTPCIDRTNQLLQNVQQLT